MTNADLGGVLNDVCGLHVLKSGNYLVSTYGNKTTDGVKVLSVSLPPPSLPPSRALSLWVWVWVRVGARALSSL